MALDHASLYVPRLGPAAAALTRVTGQAPLPTPGHPQHSRLFLHRSYLEVRESAQVQEPRLELFFLRYQGPAAAVQQALAQCGLEVSGPSSYVGVDGTWEELHVKGGEGGRPLVLVRRVTPKEVAEDWPPALEGERLSLGSVLIEASFALRAAVLKLGRAQSPRPFSLADRQWSRQDVILSGGGKIALLVPEDGQVGCERVVATELVCASVPEEEARLASAQVPFWRSADAAPALWVEPREAGIWLGFVPRD